MRARAQRGVRGEDSHEPTTERRSKSNQRVIQVPLVLLGVRLGHICGQAEQRLVGAVDCGLERGDGLRQPERAVEWVG